MIALHLVAWAGAVIALTGLLMELLNLRHFPLLEPATRRARRVVACVAARDEEGTIDACLRSLLAQEELWAIIVCDDHSEDMTRRIVEAFAQATDKIRAIRSPGIGKSEALTAAVAIARNEDPHAFLFIDADTRLEPGALSALLAYQTATGADAVSVWPRTIRRSVWDGIFSQALILFLIQALPMKLAFHHRSPAFAAANGQVLLVDRRAYETCGGHGAVDGIIEDVALARLLKASGFRIALASGARIAASLGYGSLADNVRGYGRSLVGGAGRTGCVAFFLRQLLAFAAPWPLLAFDPLPSALALTSSLLANAFVSWRMRAGSALVSSWSFGAWVVCVAAALLAAIPARTRWRGRTY